MNRFRTKKKAKDESAPRPSQESDAPAPFRLFGKGKKVQEEEPRKEIDLAAALPSNDDFRTSLLMTGLSARFSMLKEQDDPNTKIGKASDDSVLYPKRGSRLDFGLGLGDIAENESIKAPPFARIDSFHSSEGSMSGSMMDRAKPTEGNNLFGGRQKIYKIPNAGSKSSEGSMGGKVLYGDDVNMSSFQRWRQAERDRQSLEEDQPYHAASSSEIQRTESPPPVGYNRKRETNSTTSSTPSLGRNSTAATSVISQPANSGKDWQSTTTPGSNVTRTRRLYETSLMTDMQESQSSALSRMDTLSKRSLGVRTPDMSNGPSPTGNLFPDRFGDRKLLTKASAPNLRGMSPASAHAPFPPAEFGIRTPSNPETKTQHVPGGAPPLSPPISEAGESIPPVPQTRGRGGLGAFQKPAQPQPFDEAMYAQKQVQSHQDRETSANRFRAESTASASGSARSRSRSSSSAQRLPFERQDSTRAEPSFSAVQEEPTAASSGTFFITEEEEPEASSPIQAAPAPSAPPPPIPAPAVRPPILQRPSDDEHPAFRSSALPTPLSMSSRLSDGPSPTSEQAHLSVPESQMTSPIDSPTLGPGTGLSGIVRQHLRADSDGSSIYGGESAMEMNRPTTNYNGNGLADFTMTSNPWETAGQETRVSAAISDVYLDPTAAVAPQHQVEERRGRSMTGTESVTEPASRSSRVDAEEHDEFARNLSEGARRVRERLTSYVESSSRSTSPNPPPAESRETSQPRPNPLNLLRSKSSRGSMVERSRQPEPEQPPLPKANRLLGIGAVTMSSSPSPSKRSFDFDRDPLSPMNEEPEPRQRTPSPPKEANSPPNQAQKEEEEEEEKDAGMHAGLRAFRQARRELQKLKEQEVQQRRAPPNESSDAAPEVSMAPALSEAMATPIRERPQDNQRSPSTERTSPPTCYQSRGPSEEIRRPMHSSRPPSRTERDRSGSENSNGSRSQSRPARLRTMTGPQDGYGHPMPSGGPSPRTMRSPSNPMGPGGEHWRSPMMGGQARGMPGPPTGPPSGPPPGIPAGHFDRSPSGGLRVQPPYGRGNDLGQVSPISPMPPMPSPAMRSGMNSGTSTPNPMPSPRRPSQPPMPGFDTNNMARVDDSMRKFVKKKDISEPTFVSSTSRVPTVNLPDSEARSGSGSRSRSGSVLNSTASTPNLYAQANAAAHAPPLPQMNPKRRNMPGFRGGRRPEDDAAGMHPHNGPMQPEGHSTFSMSDDEDGPGRDRRRLRKATSEAHGINVRARQAQFGGAQGPPPMPVNSSGLPGGMI